MSATFHLGEQVVEVIGIGPGAPSKSARIIAERGELVLVGGEQGSHSWYTALEGKLVEWGGDKSKWPAYAGIHHPAYKSKGKI